MRERYERELRQLNFDLYSMCQKVIAQIDSSIKALINKDSELAESVANNDNVIDKLEKTIEGQCLQILLREQPVAQDFRRVSAVLKMITDIERIGDHAEDIARLAITLHDTVFNVTPINDMCRVAKYMLEASVEAYIKEDIALCNEVVNTDNELDNLFVNVKTELSVQLRKSFLSADDILSLLMIAKYLERIGDHAVNICEWTYFYKQGK